MSVKRHGPDDLIPPEVVRIDTLRPHPQNYKSHPDEQIEHLKASLQQFGQTRNVVIARDGTILAGHGVVEAAWGIDWETIEARRMNLDFDSPEALKLLALDNETPRFGITDDRQLSELLRFVAANATAGLVGTGYDENLLAALVLVSRPASEIHDADHAAEWVGMPDYTPEGNVWKLIVQFTSQADRDRFIKDYSMGDIVAFSKFTPFAISGWWPKPVETRHDGGLKWEQDAVQA